jgi:dephospho-CoA kinase
MFLQGHGFAVHSLSDVVRNEAAREGLEPTRDNLIRVGVEIRTREGPGALARRIIPVLAGRAIVDSIRNPGEVAALRTLPRFLLLGIDAPQALRFDRSIRRGRTGDGATLEEFARKEERENATTEAGQQLLATLALADRVVRNDGTIEDLHRMARAVLEEAGVTL